MSEAICGEKGAPDIASLIRADDSYGRKNAARNWAAFGIEVQRPLSEHYLKL